MYIFKKEGFLETWLGALLPSFCHCRPGLVAPRISSLQAAGRGLLATGPFQSFSPGQERCSREGRHFCHAGKSGSSSIRTSIALQSQKLYTTQTQVALCPGAGDFFPHSSSEESRDLGVAILQKTQKSITLTPLASFTVNHLFPNRLNIISMYTCAWTHTQRRDHIHVGKHAHRHAFAHICTHANIPLGVHTYTKSYWTQDHSPATILPELLRFSLEAELELCPCSRMSQSKDTQYQPALPTRA